MSRSEVDKAADNHVEKFGKIYHWSYNKKHQLVLHAGLEGKCKRHHYKTNGKGRK